MNTQELIEWLETAAVEASMYDQKEMSDPLRQAAAKLECLHMVAQAVVDNATVEMPPALIRMAESALGLSEPLEVQGRVGAPEPPKGRTVRVRIGCVVNPDETWYATGGHDFSEGPYLNQLVAKQAGRSYWITADLPIPEPVEVQGRVEP